MKISPEAADRNRIIINELLEKWKQHEENMNKESALQYIEKLQLSSKPNQAIAWFQDSHQGLPHG